MRPWKICRHSQQPIPDFNKKFCFHVLGSVIQRFLPVSIEGIEPATFRNQRMEEWLFDCAQPGGIRRYFTFDFVKIHLKDVLVKLVLKNIQNLKKFVFSFKNYDLKNYFQFWNLQIMSKVLQKSLLRIFQIITNKNFFKVKIAMKCIKIHQIRQMIYQFCRNVCQIAC